VKKINQCLNSLSIHALEKAGLKMPNQAQIDCVEASLADALKFISASVAVLNKTGISEPSIDEIRKIIKDYYQNISG